MHPPYWLGRLVPPSGTPTVTPETLPRYVAPGSLIFLASTEEPLALWGIGTAQASPQATLTLQNPIFLSRPLPMGDVVPDVQGPVPTESWASLTHQQAVGLLRSMHNHEPSLRQALQGALTPELADEVLGPDMPYVPPSSMTMLRALLHRSRGVLIMGAPGSGKTSLALQVCKQAVAEGRATGYLVASASPEWGTLETLGGYMLSAEGSVTFREGLILQAICENQWLIVDELDRANAARAFGPFLTALEGTAEVTLPYQTPEGEPIRLIPASTPECRVEGGRYYIGTNWRIIGTANGGDPTRFPLDPALVRRMAIYQMPLPTRHDLEQISARYVLSESSRRVVQALLASSPTPVTPGALTSLCGFLETSADLAVEAILSFVLPLFEAPDDKAILRFLTAMRTVLNSADFGRLLDAARYQFRLPADFQVPHPSHEGSHGPK